MLVSISEAIKMAGVSRATFYRYMETGKISIQVDGRGKKSVETSEIIRVFGEASKRPEKVSGDNLKQSVQIENVLVKQENQHLKEVLNRLEKELEQSKEREKRAEERLDAVLLRLSSTEQKEAPREKPVETPKRGGLFGLFK